MALGKTNATGASPAKIIKYDNSASGLAAQNVQEALDELKEEIPSTLPADGGNADTVDGKHASDFAEAGHDHDDEYAPKTHGHKVSDIEDFPTIPTIPDSLPADGGNADTVDGKHASDFAEAGHNHDSDYAAAEHDHTVSDITDFPTSLPADGGNADTVGGKSASDFAEADHDHDADYAAIQNGLPKVTTGGTGSAYTATVPGITALEAGVAFIMVPNVVSASKTPTLNVNGLGAKTIRQQLSTGTTTTAAFASDTWFAAGKPVLVIYNGTYWIAQIVRPDCNTLYGTAKIENGGTGATTAEGAMLNLETDNLKVDRLVPATSSDGTAYTATVPGVTELYAGLRITIIPDRVSAALSPTLNINDLGAKSIVMPIGGVNTSITTNAAKLPTWLSEGMPMEIRYDGTRWRSEITAQSAQYMYGNVPIDGGGTGAETAEEARANLGAEASGTAAGLINRTTAVNAADTNYTTLMARGTSLNSADTTPAVNGAIAWTYK